VLYHRCLAELPGRSRTFVKSSKSAGCGEKAELEGGEMVCLDDDPVLIGINTRLGRAVKTDEKF